MKTYSKLLGAEDTIAAISTPTGEGGIGIIRLSGKKALSIADRIFVSKKKMKPSVSKTYTVHYGHIMDKEKDEIIDEVIVTVMRAPGSYTKEDVVEINCHGGIVPLRKALDLVLSLGARLAEPGEFTKRAFINGRIDLAQAEAVLDIIKAKTESSMKVALGHLEGGFSKKINSIKQRLVDVLGETEAKIDFSDEDIKLLPNTAILKKAEKIQKEMESLISNAWQGMILREGLLCVICGKPNVGKSSLMNVLLRRNRVIVTPVPGTTRDAIEEEINLNGIPVRLVDTAGISKAKDIVETHGIRKSKFYIKQADLIIFMLDLNKGWSKADASIFNNIKRKNFLIVANKSDLKKKLDLGRLSRKIKTDSIVELSLLRKKNIDKLEKAVLKKIWRGELPHPEGNLVTNMRHKKDLEQALKCLERVIKTLKKDENAAPEIMASDIKEALFFLGSILGDMVEPDILDRIFSRFCIGK